jgi:biotin synthase
MQLSLLKEKALNKEALSFEEGLFLINTPDGNIFRLLSASDEIRRKFKGKKIKLCSIVNAKSGRCSENCSFCAQSVHHKTDVETYNLISPEEVFSAAKNAEENMKSTCFSIVTSGKGIKNDNNISLICDALTKITEQTELSRCVSIGTVGKEELKQLKRAGLTKLHHNLETAESFFSKMCTTHKFEERVKTVKLAKEAGLGVCSGGIFGIGEKPRQRVELAMKLRELNVDSVPINILNPVKGTPAAEAHQPMQPMDVLRLIATFRFILPDKDIGLFGGREYALQELQPLMFAAGANVTLTGDYLTTKGQPPERDLQMIKDLDLELEDGLHN